MRVWSSGHESDVKTNMTKVKEQHRNDKTFKARTIDYLHLIEN